MFNDPDPREAGLILQGIGLALIIVYAVTVTSVSLPLAPLQPQWIERVGGSLRGGASFPLVGAGLMVVAEMLDPGSWRLARRVGRIRRLAIKLAAGDSTGPTGNITTATRTLAPSPAAPGPVPLLAAAVALRFSRKLRSRIRSLGLG